MLEAYGHLHQLAANGCHHAVDQAGGNQGLTYGAVFAPAGTVSEQVLDGHSQEVVGVHQAVGGDDAVTVRVGVVTGGDVVGGGTRSVGGHGVTQRGHGVGRGAVHADLAIPVQSHEGPGGVHLGVDHGEVEAVTLANLSPVFNRGAT